LNFQYSDPEHNFKRSSVKGLVCKLFKLKEKRAATALEIAGGGKVSRLQFLNANVFCPKWISCLKLLWFTRNRKSIFSDIHSTVLVLKLYRMQQN
jgi:hypothetical protein